MDSETDDLDVPLRNVYYLLCYAWNRLEQLDLVSIDAIPTTKTLDLFGHVLATGVAHVVRRGMDRGYITNQDDIAGIRGKLELTETTKRLLHMRGRTQCSFDELSYDTLPNRLLKATLKVLSSAPDLHRDIRDEVRMHLHRFCDVTDISATTQQFRRVQLHRNNNFYSFLLDVCELIASSALPSEYGGHTRFRSFLCDPKRMPKLFEHFVINFLRREQGYRVDTPQIRWAGLSGTPEGLRLVPIMQTDAVVAMPNAKLIIDTKFYKNALSRGQYGERLDSSNLYQMFAYMTNMAATDQGRVDGLLLYPTVHYDLDERYEVGAHTLRVRTVDLSRDWQDIHVDLLKCVA